MNFSTFRERLDVRITPESTRKLVLRAKLPSYPLVFTDYCSIKLIRMNADENNFLKEVKKAVEEVRPLDRFLA